MTSVWPTLALRCAQLVLAMLIGAALASTVSFARQRHAAGPEPIAGAVGIEPRTPLTLADLGVIAQRNLFRRTGPVIAVPLLLPRSRLELTLVGTVVAGGADPGRSIALVRDKHDRVLAVRQGEHISGSQALLISIEPRRIVIERAGTLEMVSLESEQEAQPVAQLELEAHAPPLSPAMSAFSAASEAEVLESLRNAARIPPRPQPTTLTTP